MFSRKPKEPKTEGINPIIDTRLRVIRIIGDKEIIINGGENRYVNMGDTFRIYNHSEHCIKDPFSGENLGALKIYKGDVRATTVMGKMAICHSNKFVGLMPNDALYSPIEPLDINMADVTDVIEPRERVVVIGDYLERYIRD